MKFPRIEKISSNRSFGLLFFLVFFTIALWSFRGDFDQIKILPFFISLIFLILGLINSNLLTPLNRLWHYLGIILGMIVSPIVMAAIFFLVVSPIGLIMRLLGKDLLKLKTNKNIKSYWISRDKIKSTMKNQF
ncbi:MAG: hypothetical protein CL393_09545 [Acidiferrobacteraceae bacterium]|jgi:hypothetical protein|nr:hypothetical protein [Acidiferrobacteraceae bacterium]|tara:strand:- start:3939 stop:4337 length:399 start_codon:yes stop_codon:yes gene_type:complete